MAMPRFKDSPRRPYFVRGVPVIRTKRQMRFWSAVSRGSKFLRGAAPYMIGGLVSTAARSDGPSVFDLARPTVSALVAEPESTSFYLRNSSNLDEVMEEYYFG